jgi:hypothetical protein
MANPFHGDNSPGKFFVTMTYIALQYWPVQIDDLVNAPTATAAGQFPNSILETFNRFGMDANTEIRSGTGKAKPEVLTPPGIADGALGFINLEFESLGNEATDTFLHSACGPIAANIDDTIVSVSNKPMPSTF